MTFAGDRANQAGMGEGLPNWSESVGPSLLAAAIWTFLLASVCQGLNESRRSYAYGLAAAVGGYLLTIAATAVWLQFSFLQHWALLVLVAPLIEELARLFGVVQVRQGQQAWLAFGLGYGLFEFGLKFADHLTLYLGSTFLELAAALAAPFVPLTLHVFVSVLMFALLRWGVAPLLAFLTTLALHAAHNASAIWIVPDDYLGLLISSLTRVAIFVLLIWLILGSLKRLPTPEAQSAG